MILFPLCARCPVCGSKTPGWQMNVNVNRGSRDTHETFYRDPVQYCTGALIKNAFSARRPH